MLLPDVPGDGPAGGVDEEVGELAHYVGEGHQAKEVHAPWMGVRVQCCTAEVWWSISFVLSYLPVVVAKWDFNRRH